LLKRIGKVIINVVKIAAESVIPNQINAKTIQTKTEKLLSIELKSFITIFAFFHLWASKIKINEAMIANINPKITLNKVERTCFQITPEITILTKPESTEEGVGKRYLPNLREANHHKIIRITTTINVGI